MDLSVLDISGAIIRKVDRIKHYNEYFYLAIVLSLSLAFVPALFRLQNASNYATNSISDVSC